MKRLLENQSAIVTGGARGIGRAIAETFISHGAFVYIADVDRDELQRFEDANKPFRKAFETAVVDVADEKSIEEFRALVEEAGKPIDTLVNNAAILDENNAGNVSLQRWEKVFATNLTSVLSMTQAFHGSLSDSRNPSVINTLSTQADHGQKNSVAYASAKGGLLNLTRSMAVDFAVNGIRVNGVSPGFIDTRMAVTSEGLHEHQDEDFKTFYLEQGRIPLRRPGTPSDCAGAYVFLASTLSTYITGQTIVVDGGLTATY